MDEEIILISPPSFCVEDDRLEQNLGLAYIASLLIKHGFSVNIIELTGNKHKDFNEILYQIPLHSKIYGISCYSTNYNNVKKIVEYIRRNSFSSYICVGGPHPTAMPQKTYIDLGVDSVVVGEGELSMLSIVKNYYNGQKDIGIIPAKIVENLDEFPFPNRTLVDQNSYSRTFHGIKTLSLISSRGCRFRCLHCNSVVMGGANSRVRYRSVKNVINELEYLKTLGYNTFRFNDDNFADNPFLLELLKKIKEINVCYRIFSRLEHLTENNVRMLRESGCNFISIGLESLNEKNLKFLGKYNMINHLKNLEIAGKYGITIRSSFMVGLPYDNDESILNSFEKAGKLNFQEFAIYPLIPYPGTPLWSYPKKFGYEIIDRDFTKYVQIGQNKKAAFVLTHLDHVTGEFFKSEDVKRWLNTATNILESHGKKHISKSEVAK